MELAKLRITLSVIPFEVDTGAYTGFLYVFSLEKSI
jgi:hypothetical protein